MRPAFVVTGTDTDVGKTVFAAALVAALDGCYWKPVQAGLAGETDAEIVRRLSDVAAERIIPEVYRLTTAASPHLAAERDGIEIDVERLAKLPDAGGAHPLVIEGAGGLMVPLTRRLPADRSLRPLGRARHPVRLAPASAPSTTASLSIEALKRRGIPLLGIAFVGDEQADSERTISAMGGVRRLGRLPHLDPLDAASLRAAFDRHFRRADFLADVST